MIDLQNRHVVVVGGSRGIGAAAAKMAATAGANVSVVFRSNEAAAEAVVAEIRAAGRKGQAYAADASLDAPLQDAMDRAAQALGPIKGLVVSAGIFEGAPIDEMTVEFWDRTMAMNLRSTFLSIKCALSSMREAGNASVVVYTSTAGQRGSAVYSAYAASKAAQIMFMRSMAKELAPHIRVNCIAPSWTESDMSDPSLTALGRAEVVKSFPLGRIGLPDDVAGATVYLLSDLAAFVTGSTVTVDGGADMRG